jgi:hypothetical protein
MNKGGFSVVVGISVAVLAGCQSQAVRFQVQDQRVPEQVGFHQEWNLGENPSNLGGEYAKEGELRFRLFRLTNTSPEKREIYPSIRSALSEPVLQIAQFLIAPCPRTQYSCLPMDVYPVPAVADLLTEYDSKFDVLGGELEFENGTRESIPFENPDRIPSPVSIRAGESVEWVLRVRMRPEFVLFPSDPIDYRFASEGKSFIPPDLGGDPVSTRFRAEEVVKTIFRLSASIGILARDPATDVLNPVYLSEPSEPFTQGNPAFSTDRVARKRNGLAVLR